MSDLLDAVNALTQPISETIKQPIYQTVLDNNDRPKTNDTGDIIRVLIGERTVKLNHAPLLDRLEAAITSTMARHGGGGTDKHARNLLDSQALFECMRIAAAIKDWCGIVGIRATRNPTKDLRAWYVARLATNPDNDEFYIDQLYKWSRTITAKLNQPRSWELSDPCPVCKANTWVDVADENGHHVEIVRNRPLTVEYWPDQLDIASTATARCRACGEEWFGGNALVRLREHLDAPLVEAT